LSQFALKFGARNQSDVRVRLLPTSPPGDWTGVQHPLHGENNGCEEKEGCEEGRRQEEEVGSVPLVVTKKPALCAGFLVSGILTSYGITIGSPLVSSSLEYTYAENLGVGSSCGPPEMTIPIGSCGSFG
jgi:hypothetical protein